MGGKLMKTTDLNLDIDDKIKERDQDGRYKYLENNEGDGIQEKDLKRIL